MFYGLIKAILSPIFRVTFRIRVSGLENVPASGGLIIACNHQAFCDSLFLPFAVRRRVTFVAKAEYFQSWKTRWFFRALGQIPLERSGGSASQKALGDALEVLASGGCIGIYPEGTRSPDERLHRGRTGVARLALAAKCPVVPAGIRGTRAIQPIGARMLRPFKPVDIRFGPPIDLYARYGDRMEDPLVLRQATDEIMWEIRQLSGQEYVDRYASRAPQAAGATGLVAAGSSTAAPATVPSGVAASSGG
ncbi:MAG TPA: lysophospholipid acyltransferase family protein [Acidimicrobiales bacterium]|nr:lysophospholipid acyltransferase family protein [Acidimicrobiales bacterium]